MCGVFVSDFGRFGYSKFAEFAHFIVGKDARLGSYFKELGRVWMFATCVRMAL